MEVKIFFIAINKPTRPGCCLSHSIEIPNFTEFADMDFLEIRLRIPVSASKTSDHGSWFISSTPSYIMSRSVLGRNAQLLIGYRFPFVLFLRAVTNSRRIEIDLQAYIVKILFTKSRFPG